MHTPGMQVSAAAPPIPQLEAARVELARLVDLTGPGLEVAPVVSALAGVRDAIDGARPQLVALRASDWLLGELDRVRGAAHTLGDSLTELAERDGMHAFDPAFASDDASWDASFTEFGEILASAQRVAESA